VAVSADQTLISHGPYRFLRHPLYVGLFLLTVSVPLFFKNIPILLLSMLYMGYLLNQRMRVEEQAMERILGERYRVWKAKRYRFIPFIY
jgi:protein-S-isoprenylcysteine O-methyltransferase Ste14